MQRIHTVTRQNAERVGQVARASASLHEQVAQLRDVLRVFRLEEGEAAASLSTAKALPARVNLPAAPMARLAAR